MIEREFVKKLATLSRLALSEAEIEELVPKLGTILEFVGELNRATLKGMDGSGEQGESVKVRDDVLKPSLGQEKALSLAPDSYEGHFRVAKIIEN